MTKTRLLLNAAVATLSMGTAQAQEAPACSAGTPDCAEAIIVTGSRIARARFETVEPLLLVSSEAIEMRGFDSIGQALKEQPSFGTPGATPIGEQSPLAQGQSFVNFLGLGSQRTLTLVDGRRFVSSNTASIFGPTGAGSQVDLNLIPTKLVERIETIAVGGAPIYGADAIAGTVNIVLARDYEGFEIDSQAGISSRGDAASQRVRALAGSTFGDGRGNITIAADYSRAEGLTGADRALFAQGGFFGNASDPTSPFLQELYRDRRLPAVSEGGIPLVGDGIPLSAEQQIATFGFPGFHFGVTGASGLQLRFDENGALNPIDFGRYAGAPGTFGVDFEGGNGFSAAPSTNLLASTRRASAVALARYDLTDSVQLFGEAWYANSKGRNLRTQPVFNTGLAGPAGSPDGNILVSIDNPYLSTDARAAIVAAIDQNPLSDQNLGGFAQDYFYLSRANSDLTTGESTGEVELVRLVAGLAGTFEFAAGRWNWEAAANVGRSRTKSRSRELVQQNFLNAVDAVRDSSGNIICRPGAVSAPIATLSSSCAPLNLFGTGQSSQAALDYISAIATPVSLNKQRQFTASLTGPLLALPGGDFAVALGYEHRSESQDFDPGTFFYGAEDPDPLTDANGDGDPSNDRIGYGRATPVLPVYGKYDTHEISAEFLAPIVAPASGAAIDLFEVKGAARYVHHSLAGGDWTWTLGGRLGIISDLVVRGNFTRAIRAPAITELFNPSSSFFGFATDPCDAVNRGNGPHPAARQANCAADGLPANFQSLSNSRTFAQAIAGNPALANEKANSWTLGVVLEPRFAPRLRASVDYVDIELEGAISSGGASSIVASCYDSSDFANAADCARFTRGPDGQLSFVEVQFLNLAQQRYKGYLAALDYRIPVGSRAHSVGFNVSYQYIDELSTRADAASQRVRLDGMIGYAKHQALVTVDYRAVDLGMFAQLSYIGKARINPQAAPSFYPDGLDRVPAIALVNLGASLRVGDRFALRLALDNVFDRQPPYPYPATGGSTTYFSGLLGRYARLGASANF
ncbi:TonB-dependent receptor domain-containing protein [Sphingopyxis flava]|uniref:TonB-dependent Receptor Plug Domain n=1 Tax=Sphingopyxis flava TaxID=1507287 RepID=A0A1T5AAZ6_9SPHN|nr:TonB-dependent receptor [Sphingopyxis flava]SKB31853.1 TonB-dependent Receptor Plug Domain [Sphingopyxis flava]